jgi:hypothetical protein
MFTEGIVARIMRSHNVMGANEPGPQRFTGWP